MHCQRCNSNRIASINAKTRDLCHWEGEGISLDGYTPKGVGISTGPWGTYIKFDYCLDCGQIQGEFPISKEAVENLR